MQVIEQECETQTSSESGCTLLADLSPWLKAFGLRALAIGGLMVAGWLLGAGQAHADTTTATSTVSGVLTSTVGAAGSNLERTVSALPADASRPASARQGSSARGLPRLLSDTAHRVLPSAVSHPVAAITAVADHTLAATSMPAVQALLSHPAVAGPALPHAGRRIIQVTGGDRLRGGHTVARTGHPGHLASRPSARSAASPVMPPLQHQGGTVPASAGPAGQLLLGAGEISQVGLPAPMTTYLAPHVGAVPPAVMSAADEPGFAPD